MRVVSILIGLLFASCVSKDKAEVLANKEAARYHELSVDQQLKGNFDSVLFYIDKAIQADSSISYYYFERLYCLWTLGRNEEALIAAKKISKIRNYNNVSLEGVAYEKLGDKLKSKELYKQALYIWPKEDMDSNYQSRLRYSQFGTVVYGKEFGLIEISKIDTSKLNSGEIKIVETMRRTIERYQGDSYQQLMENINVLPNGRP